MTRKYETSRAYSRSTNYELEVLWGPLLFKAGEGVDYEFYKTEEVPDDPEEDGDEEGSEEQRG